MKAYAQTSPDQPATLVDLPDPTVDPGQVRIRVRAAAAFATFGAGTRGQIVLVVG